MQPLQSAIASFVAGSEQPALSEPGEELIRISGGNLSLEEHNGVLLLEAWDEHRNLSRRVAGIESQTRAKMVLRIERFGKKTGTLALLDLSRCEPKQIGLETARLKFREIFRRLQRDLDGYKIAEVSTAADLEHTLSPAFPRALLTRGSSGIAVMGAPPTAHAADAVLSFGLIWLDYLRRRERSILIRGLILFLPAGLEKTTCLRIHCLDPLKVDCSVFVYTDEGFTSAIDLSDYGNIDTRLEPCRARPQVHPGSICDRLAEIPGVESMAAASGLLSFRVRGLEFARWLNGELSWGLETKRVTSASNGREIESLARELVRVRCSDADRQHPLYRRNPESWLESQVRAHLEELDPTLCPDTVYGQVPAFAAAERGILDLLAIDRTGRLAVIELKASADIHLPLQALDYWMRVKWHLERNEFEANHYFPGQPLRQVSPRLLLVGPALDFHPSNECVLRFFSPEVHVERWGVGIEWRKQLKLMYRM